ncbi:MAG: NADH-quinone oxidoreductase subunit C [Campylobacterota bacterium]|nr:NADH-quinone oxidoreductase subunit C [Campylobacterota bacterium]
MRAYTPKNDVQKKSYYNDRFYVKPTLKRDSIYIDSVLSEDCRSLKNVVEILDTYIELDHLVIYINPEDNLKAIKHLQTVRAYDFLIELTAVDYIATRDGFEIIYEMLSTTKRKRLRVKTFIKKDQGIESVNPLFRMADWSEREMYDMYGIYVNNHPFLKRIIMPDDWQGHPLLKTYPLQGDETASWYEVDKIFGKEARDTIGPELRDAACVDRYDTERFARLGHEVPFGTPISEGNEPDTPIRYQEEGGVKLFGATVVTPFDTIEKVQLKERK